jgi:tetratricopeptide (TPR) repeat protein
MARAAVKAKQQATAKAQAQARSRERGRRKHSGGGNPNQELFFVRLRRHQKWVYAVLAVVFALSFVFVGVGSGSGGGLSQLYDGIFGGGGGTSISKAQDEIKTNPKKGYRDLITAYEQKGDNASAITALQTYLASPLFRTDANSWAELGGLQLSQGSKYATQYQNAQAAAQAADPSASFLPGGTLGSAVGQNPTYAGASQKAAARTSALYTKATTALAGAVKAYQKVTKIKPRSATAWEELATAASNAGNAKVAVHALRQYLKVYPASPLRSQIEKQIKQLDQQIAATSSAPTVSSGK